MFEPAEIIFKNLISNSIKYIKDHGLIQLSFKTIDGGGCKFEVRDNGIGMSPEFVARLNKEDSPIREGRAEGVDGDGIGWVSIKRETKKLGWTFDIESAVGKGTNVILYTKPGDIVPFDQAATVDVKALLGGEAVPAADLIKGFEVFAGIKPWAGFEYRDEGRIIDITKTPAFKAIDMARKLMEQIREKVEIK